MRIRRLAAGLVLAALVSTGAVFTVTTGAQADTTTDIADLARDNIGKMACSTNSLGGANYGSSCTGAGGSPENWCADFAMWVWGNRGVDHMGALDARAVSFYEYGQEYDTFTRTAPQVGDAAVFSRTGVDIPNSIHHVALVVKVSGDDVQVVSGNWGDSASTSHVVLNDTFSAAPGLKDDAMGQYLVGYVSPEGVTIPTGRRNSGAAVYTPGNNYHVFGIKKSTGVLWQNTWSAAWGGWQNLSGELIDSPAVTYHDGRYDVFAVSPNGAMYQKTFQDGAWSSYHSLGGGFIYGAAAIYENGDYHVFGISPGGTLFQNTWNGHWLGWQNLGGDLQGTPAVTYHNGRFDVFGSSLNGAMYQKTYTSGDGWSSWHSIGGGFKPGTGAGAVYDADGAYHVFGISPDGTLFQNTWNGQWLGWQNLGGTVTGTPAITLHGGRYDVFVPSPNGAMYQKTYTSGDGWSSWHSIGGNFN